MNTAFLISIGAGLASAVLYASAWTGTFVGVLVLFFLSPLPVAIAGLSWGWAAGAIAAIVGAATVAVAGGMRSSIVYAVALGAPAAVFSYFAMLNRGADPNDPQGQVEWYPIGRIVAWATLWAALTATAALLSIGTDFSAIKSALQGILDKTLFADGLGPGGSKVTPEQKSAFATLMTSLMPWAFATTWFTVAILNLWAAGHVTLRSGRLTRPWPDLSDLSLPPGMSLAFGASVIGMMMPDIGGLIAACFASALVFAFMLVGLGILHRVTRGYTLRPLLLAMVYSSLMLLPPFSNLIVAMIGLAEPFLRGRLPPPDQPVGPAGPGSA